MATYNVRAPSLPIPTFDYSQKQQDQFQNALRLYFNRLDEYNNQVAVQLNSQNVLMWASAGNGIWGS